MTPIGGRARAIFKLALGRPFGMHAQGHERQIIEKSIPSAVDKLAELALGTLESGSKRFELWGQHQLKRQVRAEPDAETQVGAQLLIWPRMHGVDEELAVEANGGVGVDLLMVVERCDLA